MPGKVGVKIKAGRNLPVMDRGSDTTDAYVEIKLGNVTHKTDVCRKSLNPQWNTDWFRFEVDDAELQDEPLQIRLMDHDTYSANDAIGKVNISLNPLCLENAGHSNQGKGSVMSGWIPVFDTMHGIRGEVNIIVKVDLFSDANKFRQSSCGVQFFHSPCIPHGYRAQVIHGFVEELVVNDDPEYQWIDKIRTPRASNEARQVVFLKLSGQVQRKIGLKAINLGANAVIGYTQCFDLEGDVGVVARGIGTAVTLVKIQESFSQPTLDSALIEERTLKYLEFLKGRGNAEESFRSKFDYDTFENSPGNVVYKILGIDPVERCITKTPNVILKKKWRPTVKDSVIPEETFSENESIRQLLKQEDMRGERPPRRFRHHVRKLTNSSKNLLQEKFSAFKSKLNDDKLDRSSGSLHSSFSDISYTESLRSSLTDLRSLIRLKRYRGHKFNRSISDGSGMASVLVNSVIHGPSLNSISESHDSSKYSSKSKLKSIGDKKSESTGNLLQTTREKHFLSSRLRQNALHASDASISTISLSSATSEERFSDDCSETTPPNEVVVVDADTVSMVVKSVLAQESVDKDADNWIQPGSTQEEDETTEDKVNVTTPQQSCTESGNKSDDPAKICIPTGATRIVKQGKDAKITESKLVETSNSPVNLDTILKSPSIDEDAEKWIEPGSTTDEPETVDRERRGSLLRDIKENITDTILHLQEHIHLPHFTDDKNKSLKKSLIETSKMVKEKSKGAENSLSDNEGEGRKTSERMEKRRSSLDLLTNKLRLSFYNKVKKEDREAKGKSGQFEEGTSTACSESLSVVEEAGHSSSSLSDINKSHQDLFNVSESKVEKAEKDECAEKPKESRLVPKFNIPAISFTNLQLPTIQMEDGSYFYSSEPELNKTNDTLSPSALGMPFISLTNLNVSTSSFSSSVPNSTNSPLTLPNPSTLNSLSTSNNRIPPLDQNSKIIKSLDSARNNVLSSSYTNLSTNKAPMLAPFPCLKHSRSELATSSTSPGNKVVVGHSRAESVGCKISHSPAKVGNSTPVCSIANKDKDKDAAIYRRSSDSDLSVTPKGNSICVASERLVAATNMMRLNAPSNLKAANQENLDMLEYPFLTMAKYPPGFILHIGATVAARSVKLLERVPNPDEPETRDSWWTELRMEIRSHARALGCNVILGYSEVTTISDDVCVLSATGTAAVINMTYNGDTSQFDPIIKKDLMVSSLDEKDIKGPKDPIETTTSTKEFSFSLGGKSLLTNVPQNLGCAMCHLPYTQSSVPFSVKMKKCAVCKRGKVPDVLLATIEIPECLHITGRGCFMQAQVVRAKRDLRSESNAKEISDGLPFLEYELHRLLINKLKAKGMNAIFGLKAQVAIGEKMMALIATGTAIYLTALPPPSVPKIVAGNSWTDTAKLNELQKSLQETFERNRDIYQIKTLELDIQNGKHSDTDDSEDEIAELDLNTGSKDTCVLEVDDIEDLEIISLLMEPCPPEGFHIVNTQSVPGLQDMEVVRNLQMFTQIWRAKLTVGQNIGNFPKHFQRLLQTIFFKLRSMVPCAVCDLRFRLDLPESDEIQVLVTGMALGLGEPSKLTKLRRKQITNTSSNTNDSTIITNGRTSASKKSQDDELIFSLDEDQSTEISANQTSAPNATYGSHSFRLRKTSPSRTKFSSVKLSRHTPLRDRYGVDITPLSYVPGGKIEKYLGNLNFFFIRECTSIRENGGISGFVHSFITELLAIVRANVSALGGNAMVSFYMTELILVDNQHKNQGQCLISIGGDVVYVSYFLDD